MDKSTTFILCCLAILSTGCDQLGEQASKAVEQRVQKETDKIVDKAIGSVDKAVESITSGKESTGRKPNLIQDASLEAAGAAITSLSINESPNRTMHVYFTFEKNIDSAIEVKFINKAGFEIGRSQQRVSVKAGAGHFFDFTIDPRTNISEIVSVRVMTRKS